MSTKHAFLTKHGTETKMLTPIKAIRQKCLDCSNWSTTEVTRCQHKECALYPFRHGKDPERRGPKLSDEQKKAVAERLKKARNKKQG